MRRVRIHAGQTQVNGVIILAGHDVQAPAHDHAGRAHVRAQRDALLRGHLDDLEHHHHGAHVPGVVEEPAERHAGRHGGRKPRRGDRDNDVWNSF